MKRSTRESAWYFAGLEDRENNMPCRSANGDYLDGWYELPADGRLMSDDVHLAELRILEQLRTYQ